MHQSTTPIKSFLAALIPLYLVILLDVAGIILVMPVLTPLILQANSGLIASNTPLLLRDFLYGFALALFPLFMFFSTPILGDLSDKFGRKKILLLCLITSAVSYVIAGIGIRCTSLALLLFSRALAGLAAGTQPIATAAIIDLSTPQTKTRNLAWVVFAASLGLILGPAIGGITAENTIASWFGYDTPFFLAGAVSFVNALMLYAWVKEQSPPVQTHAIQLTKGFKLFIAAFLEKKFCILSIAYFNFVLAWSLYYQTINWFFMANYHYDVGKLGLFVAYIGIIFALTSSVGVRYLLRLFQNELTAFIGVTLAMTIANLAAALCHSELAQWLWVILNAVANVLGYTVALTIYSNLADHEAQGWIMGVTGAIGAITWTVGGLLAGPLGYLGLAIPFWVAAVLCGISSGLLLLYKNMSRE